MSHFLHDFLDFNSMQSAAAELAGSPQGKTNQKFFNYHSYIVFICFDNIETTIII